jgi:hypothetical protein
MSVATLTDLNVDPPSTVSVCDHHWHERFGQINLAQCRGGIIFYRLGFDFARRRGDYQLARAQTSEADWPRLSESSKNIV